MFRLYLDEVGTDDMCHLDQDCHRYLSLSGVVMKVDHARDNLLPAINWIKANVFDHDPDDPVIFHRSDIVKRKGKFGLLNNPEKADLFDQSIERLFKSMEYSVITALIDKRALQAKAEWRKQHPYHFLMEIMIEKYVQFLKRNDSRGDIMPEARRGKKDKALEAAFIDVCTQGTYFVSAKTIAERLTTTRTLKFRQKRDNVAGQQLCDLIAHPSHIYIRSIQNHPVNLGPFAMKVSEILVDEKYDRSRTGQVKGYGWKYFP